MKYKWTYEENKSFRQMLLLLLLLSSASGWISLDEIIITPKKTNYVPIKVDNVHNKSIMPSKTIVTPLQPFRMPSVYSQISRHLSFSRKIVMIVKYYNGVNSTWFNAILANFSTIWRINLFGMCFSMIP